MIKEPWLTLSQYQSRGNSPEGYQRFEIDLEHKLLIPTGKLETKAGLLAEFLRSAVAEKSVLDIGCDKGYFSWLSKSYGAKVVTANEKSRNPIGYAKTLFRVFGMNIEVLHQDLFRQKEERVYDLVLALAVLHQIGLELDETLAIIRGYARQGAVIEFCEDYQEVFGKTWNLHRFSEAALAKFKSMALIGEYDAVGDYKGRRYLWYCGC